MVALTLVSLPASAGKRVALVIGNSAYQHAPVLVNPKNDAAELAATLRSIGFDVIQRRDVDKRAMADAIREFSAKLPGAEVALFFFAGHGLQVGGDSYLLPVDTTIDGPADIDFSTIGLATIQKAMDAEKMRANLIFLDACRDNPFVNKLASGGRSLASRGLATPNLSGVGTLLAFATQPNNIALDGEGRNSPFTAALLKHIKTPGLEVRHMLSRVRADVIEATGDRQVPWDNSSLVGEVYVVPSPHSEAATLARPSVGALPRVGSNPSLPPVGPAESATRLKRVFVEGYNGQEFITGVFERTGPERWQEKNTSSSFQFTSIFETPEQILLFDKSRDMYFEINIKQKKTRWRLGSSSTWNNFYAVTGYE
jgi:hypothetical protein